MPSTNRSKSSRDLGNTKPSPPSNVGKQKQISPSKRWCFTFNNYTSEDIQLISSIVLEKCDVAIIGEEVGESGTPHLQGYIEFKTKSRALSVFSMFKKIHWDKARKSRMINFRYCSKDAKIALQIGYRLPQEVRILSDDKLFQWQKDIIDIVGTEADDRTIYWYWSEEGCVGKTTFCKYLTMKHGAICLHGKGADVRNGVVSYKEKNGDTPNIVLFPIPKSFNTEYLSYEALENIKDMYFYSGKYEGGMVCGNPPHLIVFANEPPELDKCSADRWKVIQIDNKVMWGD